MEHGDLKNGGGGCFFIELYSINSLFSLRYAIYIPLFLPISLPIFLSLRQAVKWYRGQDNENNEDKKDEDKDKQD